MTACSNRKGRAGRVITAALVGALSVGAPAVALAANGGVELQTVTEADAFSRGTVALKDLSLKDGVYSAVANADGRALDIVATSVTPLGTRPIQLPADGYETVIYKADDNFESTGEVVNNVVEPGKYIVAVKANEGTYKGGEATTKLSVKAASLKGLGVYEVDSTDVNNTADDKFMYTGSELSVGFSVNGVPFDEGTDYSVKILKKGTDNVDSAPAVDVLEAGDYVAYVTGLGQYKGEKEEVAFTVAPFDLDYAEVIVDDVIASDTKPAHPTRVVSTKAEYEGTKLDPSHIDLTFVKGAAGDATGSELFDKLGAYTFAVSYDKNDTNLTEAVKDGRLADKTVNKVAAKATYKYDGKDLQDSYVVNLAEGESFDFDKLKVYNGDKVLTQGKSNDYSVDVERTGDPYAYSSLEGDKVGTYTVTVTPIASSPNVNWAVGGSATFTVRVVEDVIDADVNVVLYSNKSGDVVTSVSKTYDGGYLYATDYIAKAFDKDGTPVADSSTGALTLALYDSEGKKVDAAVNAGSYTLKVTSSDYILNGTTEIPVTISKLDMTQLRSFRTESWYGAEYLPMDSATNHGWDWMKVRFDTGVAAGESDEYNDGKGWDSLGSLTNLGLESDKYLTVERYDDEKGEWVKVKVGEVSTTEGSYRITFTGDRVLARNIDFANDDYTTSFEIVVVDEAKLKFVDVKPGDWYLDSVAAAESNGYINGYSDGKFFGPKDSITRGQVATILYNMSGGVYDADFDFVYTEGKGYDTGFSDVDGTKYYGKAIAWAHATGVVSGYDGEFRPDDAVTREEFAAMLANFAELKGDDIEGASDEALNKLPDASEVSGWAEQSVAWAVENGVMGNGGYVGAMSTITRAEAAAMAVNYQPEKLA